MNNTYSTPIASISSNSYDTYICICKTVLCIFNSGKKPSTNLTKRFRGIAMIGFLNGAARHDGTSDPAPNTEPPSRRKLFKGKKTKTNKNKCLKSPYQYRNQEYQQFIIHLSCCVREVCIVSVISGICSNLGKKNI